MPTTQPRLSATFASGLLLLITATFGSLGGLVDGSDSVAPADASAAPAPRVLDLNTEIRGPAKALAPARRMSLEALKPIFPMQVEPVCYILDNFGDPRGSRIHQGTDILATLGQEVYAVVDGTLGYQTIAGEPDALLSGNSWRVTTTGKKTWYGYMHLSAFAPGLSNGSAVVQGQLIGYVGDTGNPGPGNYHLHFEVHPDGGAAVNPLTVLPIPSGCTVQ